LRSRSPRLVTTCAAYGPRPVAERGDCHVPRFRRRSQRDRPFGMETIATGLGSVSVRPRDHCPAGAQFETRQDETGEDARRTAGDPRFAVTVVKRRRTAALA
jgi:hypothetical protein